LELSIAILGPSALLYFQNTETTRVVARIFRFWDILERQLVAALRTLLGLCTPQKAQAKPQKSADKSAHSKGLLLL